MSDLPFSINPKKKTLLIELCTGTHLLLIYISRTVTMTDTILNK